MTKENLPTKANINATQSMTDVRRINGDGRTRVNGNGHEALDLAETVSIIGKKIGASYLLMVSGGGFLKIDSRCE